MKKFITCILISAFMLCSFLMPISANTNYLKSNDAEETIIPAATYDFVVNKSVDFKYDGVWYTEYFKLNVTQDLNGKLINVYNVHDCHSTLTGDYYTLTAIRSTTPLTAYKWRVNVEVNTYLNIFKKDSYYASVEISSAGPMSAE